MRRKKWKKGRTILPLLLSAILIAEPLATTATVYAEELDATEGMEQKEDLGEEETLPDSGEEIKGDTGNGTEDGTVSDDVQENEKDSEGQDGSDDASGTENKDQQDEPSETPSDSDGENNEDQDNEDENNEDQNDEDEDNEGQDTADKEEEEPNETDQNTDEKDSSGEDGSVSENGLEEESVSENDLEEEEDNDVGRFSDMPDDYRLCAAQQADKEALAGQIKNINEADEGVLYAKRQIMVEADSQEEAEMIAEAYNADIKGFDNGVLLLELRKEDTVVSAVKAAASTRNRLPAVWPNYYRYPHVENAAMESSSGGMIEVEETEYETEDIGIEAYAEREDIPDLEAYGQAAASYNDPELMPENEKYQWQHVAVGSPYAWAEGYTGSGVKVAVLDTGVKGDHEELTLAGEANATGNSLTVGSGTAADAGGHGTHVAGIIGAKANNGKGGAGIAPDATLYAVNVLNGGENAGTDWAIIQGIGQAITWDVDVINMSLGGPRYNDICQKKVTEAYNKGIAIFVSAGNDGANCINYPACYEHIICVAATDQNNSRADFSTYGSWVDVSAPGVAIWSTYNDGGYVSMDGTSMACPVATGEAAVILSGDASLKSMTKNGDRVDALEKKMKSNAVKAAGSGMGAGVTSLTKVFKLSTASVKPQAPTISIVPDDASKAQKVTVTITAQNGMNIYYTVNGKNPVYKNGEADKNTELYTTSFPITEITKGTVKAIAVNESGVASPVKSVKFTLKPDVSSITVSGIDKVAAGKSAQLTAEVLPAYATNKKVTWKLYTADGAEATAAKDKISISASGKVTAKTGVTVGAKYTARATAKDGSGKYGEYVITVIESTKLKTAKFDKKSLTLGIPKTDDPDRDLGKLLKAEYVDGKPAAVTDFKWSTNNKAIATVNENGVITPVKAGKVTITALANDSSGKKATCTVTVKQLATDIKITGSSSVAAGKGVTFKATVLPSNVTVKKVSWSVIDKATNQEPAASTGVKINKNNGKLTTKGTSKGSYTVKAVATDGSGEEDSKDIVIREGAIKTIAFSKSSDKKMTIFRRAVTSQTKTSATVDVKIEGTNAQADLDAFEVKSSNPNIAEATAIRNGNLISLTVTAKGRAVGKTNITLAAADGSGKKVTCAVTVCNPVTKVHISSSTKTLSVSSKGIDMVVVKGKSIQLKATLESEYGAVSNKKVKWSIDIPPASGITMNASGKVSAKRGIQNYQCTVTAEAADGGGAKDTYVVVAVDPATKLSVPELIPAPGYINGLALRAVPLDEDGNRLFWAGLITTDVVGGYIEAKSSNPKALEATTYYNSKIGAYQLLLTPYQVKKDTMVTVTVKATDGSGKKVSYKVYVLK